MESNSPLHIPKSKQLRGLTVHCSECGTTVGDTCRKSGADIKKCKFRSEHVFKVIAHVPVTENTRKTKTLTGIRDLNEARRLALEFQQEVKDNANFAPVAPRPPAV